MARTLNDFWIFAGNSNPDLATKIGEYLNMPLGGAKLSTFSDGEIQIEIHDNVRMKDVFIIQSTCDPVNKNLMELLLMIDAMKRASASRITAVIPYYGYARQDKKVAPRVMIRVAPARVIMSATSLALMGTLGATFLSWRA